MSCQPDEMLIFPCANMAWHQIIHLVILSEHLLRTQDLSRWKRTNIINQFWNVCIRELNRFLKQKALRENGTSAYSLCQCQTNNGIGPEAFSRWNYLREVHTLLVDLHELAMNMTGAILQLGTHAGLLTAGRIFAPSGRTKELFSGYHHPASTT